MEKVRQITLDYQQYVLTPPIPQNQLMEQACSNDATTVAAWKDIWIRQIKQNKETYESFAKHSIGKFWGTQKLKPAIIVGSGPSLKYNALLLKDRDPDIAVLSCLHNFHYLEENDISVDFYVTLDSGPITITEIFEGGKHPEEWYWEQTKTKKLFAFIGTHPDLLKKWQGEVYFYNCAIPDDEVTKAVTEVENFSQWVGTGGNVLGACMYIAKCYLGANPIAFIGADFAFSNYDGPRKFHSWNSQYDKTIGGVIGVTDVFGNKAVTWQSYFNFKCWFDFIAQRVPGLYINCTEGGTLGAYDEGNIIQIKQMDLADMLEMYSIHKHTEDLSKFPSVPCHKFVF